METRRQTKMILEVLRHPSPIPIVYSSRDKKLEPQLRPQAVLHDET